ncbi:hypothetical protein PUN4_410097 [Paraburkholderia unamae]|nr:hypothetical protein PUN4_410097 [Paraburkholderia unamae]
MTFLFVEPLTRRAILVICTGGTSMRISSLRKPRDCWQLI